jgi:hypothetical protein
MFLVLEQRDNFLAVCDAVLRKTGIDVSENLLSTSLLSPFLFVLFVMSLCYLLFLTGTDRNIMALQKELTRVVHLGLVRRLYARGVGLVG